VSQATATTITTLLAVVLRTDNVAFHGIAIHGDRGLRPLACKNTGIGGSFAQPRRLPIVHIKSSGAHVLRPWTMDE
jgi:hypothetical protein